jgi:hypothetical protein
MTAMKNHGGRAQWWVLLSLLFGGRVSLRCREDVEVGKWLGWVVTIVCTAQTFGFLVVCGYCILLFG